MYMKLWKVIIQFLPEVRVSRHQSEVFREVFEVYLSASFCFTVWQRHIVIGA